MLVLLSLDSKPIFLGWLIFRCICTSVILCVVILCAPFVLVGLMFCVGAFNHVCFLVSIAIFVTKLSLLVNLCITIFIGFYHVTSMSKRSRTVFNCIMRYTNVLLLFFLFGHMKRIYV